MTTTLELQEVVADIAKSFEYDPSMSTEPEATGVWLGIARGLPTVDKTLTEPYPTATELDPKYNVMFNEIYSSAKSFKEMHVDLKNKDSKGL